MTAAQQQAELIRQQDELRPVRQFLSLVSGLTSDQTYGDADYAGVNQPGQFSNYGPYGQAVEGQPIMTYSTAGGTSFPPIVWIGLGIAAYLMLK